MSEITVHPSYIMETVSIIEKYERVLSNGTLEISLLKSQLDHQILNRKDIESRLSDAIKSYSLIEGKLRQLHEFVEFAMRKYQTAEYEIIRKSHELDSLVNYSTVYPTRAINPGENPLRTGKDKLRNILNDLAPLIIMLNPFLLFPITYRNHLNGSPSFHFGKIKETDFYHHVLEKHKLSNEEKIAVQSYAQQQYGINPIAVKASKKNNSNKKDDAEQEEEESFIEKAIDFLFGDIAIMVAPDSTFGERVIAAGFTFFKPAKLGGMFLGSLKIADSAKDISKAKKAVVKPVSNMNEFFDTEFGKSISNSLSKPKVKYDGQSIYKVEKKTDNQYLKKGYGVYLGALHKDHLEVIDKTGNVKYVLNLDGTLNHDKTKKALGRVVKGWK